MFELVFIVNIKIKTPEVDENVNIKIAEEKVQKIGQTITKHNVKSAVKL